MITQYGMSKRFGLMGLEVAANQYLDNRPIMNCSDATAAEVDQEVMKVLKEAYEEAKRLLTEHRKALDQIAAFLIERETITGKEFMDIFYEVEGIEKDQKEELKNSARVSEKSAEALPKAQLEIPTPDTEATENTEHTGMTDNVENPQPFEDTEPVKKEEAKGVKVSEFLGFLKNSSVWMNQSRCCFFHGAPGGASKEFKDTETVSESSLR